EDTLRVGQTAINVAALREGQAQVAVVVYFAVEDDPDPPVFGRHGLAASAHVNNRQSAVAKSHRPINENAGVIGTAVSKRIAHRGKECGVYDAAGVRANRDAANPTHTSTSPWG